MPKRFQHFLSLMVIGLLFTSFVFPVDVFGKVYGQDEPLVMDDGRVLAVSAGSEADSVHVDGTRILVTIPEGKSFLLKSFGPFAGLLLNDAGAPSCTPSGGSNVVSFSGPRVVTIVPDPQNMCIGDGEVVSLSGVVDVSLEKPVSGSIVKTGDAMPVQWKSKTKVGVTTVRISLSTDAGDSYRVLKAFEENDGAVLISVPEVDGTVLARIRIDAVAFDGTSLAHDISGMFTIHNSGGVNQPVNEVVEPVGEVAGVSDVSVPDVVQSSSSINDDKQLPSNASALCSPGALIKASLPSLYYCGADGKRYVFPNEQTYKTWYDDFAGITRLTDEQLSQIPIGGNVTYRPGVRMVKITSDPRVYVVSRGGVLREILDEAMAVSLYGTEWAKLVHDVPDAFFSNYVLGAPLSR